VGPTVDILEFLRLATALPVLDVRAPCEFQQAHIAQAVNLPLFDDKQRAAIGTTYKQQGHDAAVMLGFELAGPKMATLAQRGRELALDRQILLHCARGGMRSESMAWLLQQAGLQVTRLRGGYKSFRQHVLKSFEQPIELRILSGLTGAGKTQLLAEIRRQGEQVIDLEGLAHHRGSAFGGIGQPDQPASEHFENLLFQELQQLDPGRPVWLEDESRNVGRVFLPEAIWLQMRNAPVFFLDVTVQRRAQHIRQLYGDYATVELIEGVERVRKRLGGLRAAQAIAALENGRMDRAIEILLDYYDKSYLNAAASREAVKSTKIPVADEEAESTIVQRLIETANQSCALSRS
jgi:tRNA 2-selenouridine synthase